MKQDSQKKKPRRWTCAVHFLVRKHWTTTIAVTIEGGSLSAIASRAIREAKKKARTSLAGKRLSGVTVKAERFLT